MKTTTVRKLLPEGWGFLCPVHTPDGSPCGLLNHITLSCAPLAAEEIECSKHQNTFKKLLSKLGMNPIGTDFGLTYPQNYIPVLLDGKLMGSVDPKIAIELVKNLRAIKITQHKTDDLYECVPKTMEIAFLPSNEILNMQYSESLSTTSTNNSDQDIKEKFFPGIYLST